MISCNGLRLLIVGPYPPPFGGIASHLVTLVPGLRRRGAEDIAIVSFGNKDEVTDIEGAKVYRFETATHANELARPGGWRALAASVSSLSGGRLGARAILREATKAMLIDRVARAHSSNVASFYQSDLSLAMMPCARMWGRRRGLVLTVFGEVYDNPALFESSGALMRRMFELPAAIASSSRHCANSFKRVGVTREIEPVYYGVDLERLHAPELREPFRAERGVARDEVLLVFMGRFTDEMGLGRLLDVAPSVLDGFGSVKLMLAGAKGPLSSDAGVLATRYPGRVMVMNDVPFAIQPALYAASDVVLAPTHDQHACMGMSIKEAMAAARPVIGSLAGGIPEAIVDGETGYLVPLDDTRHIDAQGLQQAIFSLSNESVLRERMGRSGRARAEAMFTMDLTIDRMSELFMSARPAG